MTALQVRRERDADEEKLLLETKTMVLRQHEVYCYQIAYYVLQQDDQARQAAERALTELFSQHCFYKLSEPEQLKEVKSAGIRCALQVRKKGLQALGGTSR